MVKENRVTIDLGRVNYWISVGAQPTVRVQKLIKEVESAQTAETQEDDGAQTAETQEDDGAQTTETQEDDGAQTTETEA